MTSYVNAFHKFLSTPSARRATQRHQYQSEQQCISIHALREEGDHAGRGNHKSRCYFYPRPPRGGRLAPARYALWSVMISIHALREEGDDPAGKAGRHSDNFYPRPPRGGRHKDGTMTIMASKFLSTPSARRATDAVGVGGLGQLISIHALREEGDERDRRR